MSKPILNTGEIKVDGKNLSYFEKGVGKETVICLPGWPMGKTIFVKMLECVQPNSPYRYIALDYPGWGGSDLIEDELNYDTLGKVVIEYMKAKNISKTHLLGVSFGAALALNIAYQYSDRVNSVVASAPPVFLRKYIKPTQRLFLNTTTMFPVIKKFLFKQMVQEKRWAWKLVFPELTLANDELLGKNILEEFKKTSYWAVDETLNQIIKTDLRNILPKINTPVLVMTGSKDYMLEDSIEAVAELSNAKLRTVGNGDHTMVVNMSKEFMNNVTDFLNGLRRY